MSTPNETVTWHDVDGVQVKIVRYADVLGRPAMKGHVGGSEWEWKLDPALGPDAGAAEAADKQKLYDEEKRHYDRWLATREIGTAMGEAVSAFAQTALKTAILVNGALGAGILALTGTLIGVHGVSQRTIHGLTDAAYGCGIAVFAGAVATGLGFLVMMIRELAFHHHVKTGGDLKALHWLSWAFEIVAMVFVGYTYYRFLMALIGIKAALKGVSIWPLG